MKKIYTKPDIAFDSFSMSASIASSCPVHANFQQYVCGVELTESMILFDNSVQKCNWYQQDGEYDGLCYHVFTDTNSVFVS